MSPKFDFKIFFKWISFLLLFTFFISTIFFLLMANYIIDFDDFWWGQFAEIFAYKMHINVLLSVIFGVIYLVFGLLNKKYFFKTHERILAISLITLPSITFILLAAWTMSGYDS